MAVKVIGSDDLQERKCPKCGAPIEAIGTVDCTMDADGAFELRCDYIVIDGTNHAEACCTECDWEGALSET